MGEWQPIETAPKDGLGDMRRDYLWESKWVALGVGLGVAPAACTALNDFFSTPRTHLDIVDLIQIIILFVSLAAFAILWRVMRGKSRDAKDLVTAIRDRTRKESEQWRAADTSAYLLELTASGGRSDT